MSIIIDKLNHIYTDGGSIENYALRDINLKIEDGEMLGIIGHTGSGKSTLIQHLNGLLKPTSGTIYYNGQDIQEKDYNRKSLRTKVGLVFQNPEYQLFESTVIKDVKFGPINKGLEPLQVDLCAFDALQQVGITEDLLDASPMELSGGQKRKVAIAGILAMKPEVMILDEPTAGLDPKGRKEILELIKKLHHDNNMTVIIVSHSMEDMADYVERLIVLKQGEIFADGTPKEVFQHYEKLEGIGLAAPQMVYVLNSLRKRGYPITTNGITVEEAKAEILSLFRRKEG